jgi:hypothetical protein
MLNQLNALTQEQTPVLKFKPAPHLPSGFKVASDALSAQLQISNPLHRVFPFSFYKIEPKLKFYHDSSIHTSYRTKSALSIEYRSSPSKYKSLIRVQTFFQTQLHAMCMYTIPYNFHRQLFFRPLYRFLYFCLGSSVFLGLIRTRYFYRNRIISKISDRFSFQL